MRTRFFVNLAVWSLVTNGLWELAQCVLYFDMRGTGVWAGTVMMTLAIAGDVGVVLALYGLTTFLSGGAFPLQPRFRAWMTLLSLSVITALALEYMAVVLGLWKYNNRMETLSLGGHQVGWSPVLQIGLLPMLSIWMAMHKPLIHGQPNK